eukprot:TRINITY_DN7747_c0_g1_i2.p1 TRINITY_DN7747_c0_g1~~TRINITY_DN7747_c0_g1_i2.p1  ORF type:complete len:211 (-),score=77.44 TRINITY_DN7747_c0_g1_i2:195-827(-)
MEAAHAERSKLVQRQKQQRQELEKKIKKLKGAMKEAAQKELDELEEKHEAELAEFDGSKGVAGAASASKEEPEEKAISAEDAKKFRERNWSGLSKKELEEECVLRGLGKKGSKEDLIQKLIIFQQELKSKTAAGGYAASSAPQVLIFGAVGIVLQTKRMTMMRMMKKTRKTKTVRMRMTMMRTSSKKSMQRKWSDRAKGRRQCRRHSASC